MTSTPSSTNDKTLDPISTSEPPPSSTNDTTPDPNSTIEPAPNSTREPAPSSTGDTTLTPSSTSHTTSKPSSDGDTTPTPIYTSNTTPTPSSTSDTNITPSSTSDTTLPPSSTSKTTPAPSSNGVTTPSPSSTGDTDPISSSNGDTTSAPYPSSSQTSVRTTQSSIKTGTGASSTVYDIKMGSTTLNTATSQAKTEVTSQGPEVSKENSMVSKTGLTEQNSTILSSSTSKKELIAKHTPEALTSETSIHIKSTLETVRSSQAIISSNQETFSFSNKTSTPTKKTSDQMQETAIPSQEAVSSSRKKLIPSQQPLTTNTGSVLRPQQRTSLKGLGIPNSLSSSGPVTTDVLIPRSPLMDLDPFTADTESRKSSIWTTEMVSHKNKDMDIAGVKNKTETVTQHEVIELNSTSETSLKDSTATANQPLIVLTNSTEQNRTIKSANPKKIPPFVLKLNKNTETMIPFDKTNHKPVVAQIDEKHIIQMMEDEIPPMFEGEDPIERTEINQVIRSMLGDSDEDATAHQQRQKREALHEHGFRLPRKWRMLNSHQRAARGGEVADKSGR